MSSGYRVTVRQGWNGPEHVLNSEKTDKIRLQTAQLTKDVTAYDSFQFTISPTHPQYANLNMLTSFIKVTRPDEDKTLFEGRIVTPQDEIDNDGTIFKTITCEGLEGFLHDSVQPFAEFHNTTPKDFLQAMINNHNAQVEDYKKILLGNVTVTNSTDNVYRFLEDDKDTYDNITDKLITDLGGEIRVRHEVDALYLDYEPQIGGDNSQSIALTKNLLGLIRSIDGTSLFTVLKPLGSTQEPTDDTSTDTTTDVAYPRLTIADVNHDDVYLRDATLIAKYGTIIKTNTWDDVTTADVLFTKGQEFLKTQKNFKTQFQVTYVDLSHIDQNKFTSFDCGSTVHLINPLQGIDITERITGMVIDLLDIPSSTMTIGEDDMNQISYEKMTLQQFTGENSIARLVVAQRKREAALNNTINSLKNTTNKLSDNDKTTQQTIKDLQDQVKALQDGNWTAGSIFVDLSSNNGATSTTDQEASWYSSLVSKGAKGAIIKFTQGTTYTNPLFTSQKANVISAGMKFIGAYHFLTSTTVSGAQSEAQYFLSKLQANSIDKNTIVACDIESGTLPSDKSTLTSMITAFYKVLIDVGYSNTVDYASASWFGSRFTSVAKYKWIASYGVTTAPLGADAWQSTDNWLGLKVDASYSYNKIFI